MVHGPIQYARDLPEVSWAYGEGEGPHEPLCLETGAMALPLENRPGRTGIPLMIGVLSLPLPTE